MKVPVHIVCKAGKIVTTKTHFMAAHHVLNENWSDYDDRKKRHTDANFFSCEEEWEVKYLINKIIKTHPHLTEHQVKLAISSCCSQIRAPRPRKQFVECVMGKLV